ncbi:hypothetical protein DPMN_172036 [Dreissena polymorpha]|uniref:Uncharacterized protein n=1 Tax=Dreissena polymorpha TaxID=45954 RepID=A0A9D4E0U1_DREPO|nr:hypothetical protein DPMN_172036 [Dreissena polymorpha]
MSDIVPFAGTAAPAELKNVTDGAAVGVDYTLNMRKSLQKKLDSTDQEDVIVYETGGGFRLLLNTGMYELFKIAADQFFSNNTIPYKCCNVPVHDRQGNLVESQYKFSSGRQGIYIKLVSNKKFLFNQREKLSSVHGNLPASDVKKHRGKISK